MPTQQRVRRIEDLIQRNLAELLRKEVSDPRLTGIVITSVDVSPDIKQAKIFFSLLKIEDASLISQILNNASGYLRTLLAQAISLRYTPRLIFIHDDSIERATRIDKLLGEISFPADANDDDNESK